jgi:hypothetical protein
MECSCDYDSYGDPIDCCTVKHPKARTEKWRCHECGRPIKKGEQYEYVRGLFDGEWDILRTCLGCSRLRQEIGCPSSELVDAADYCFGVDIRHTAS